jgi:hypothetical protein
MPKSTDRERIAENIAVFDFELTDDALAAVDGLNSDIRGGPEPIEVTIESFVRPIPEDWVVRVLRLWILTSNPAHARLARSTSASPVLALPPGSSA